MEAQKELAPQVSQSVEERVEITAFSDDSAVLPEDVPGESSLPMMGTSQFTDTMHHSIISFLERPQLLSVFKWPLKQLTLPGGLVVENKINQDLLYTDLNKYPVPEQYPARWKNRQDFPGALIPSQIFRTMQRRKLDGFAGFRATAVFKLQINSQPFIAGRLLMAAVPMPLLLGQRGEWLDKTIPNIQNINHVQMDICKQTEVILRVPFISPYNCYDLITGNFDWARLFIKIYGPMNTTSEKQVSTGCNDNALTLMLWSHFEDIQLGYPTSASMYTPPPNTGFPKPKNLKEEVPKQQSKMLTRLEKRCVKEGEKSEWLQSKCAYYFPQAQSGRLEEHRKKLPSLDFSQKSKVKPIDPNFFKKGNHFDDKTKAFLAKQQSGFVPSNQIVDPNQYYIKGNFLGALYLKDNTTFTLKLPAGTYFVDIFTTSPKSADNTGYMTQDGGFNIGMSPDQTLSWSGPLYIAAKPISWAIYNDGCAAFVYIYSSVSVSEPMAVTLPKDPLPVTTVTPVALDTGGLFCSYPGWVTNTGPNDPNLQSEELNTQQQSDASVVIPIDQTSDSVVQGQDGSRTYFLKMKHLPRAQSGLRMPPTEASNAQINSQRQSESDGRFARTLRPITNTVTGVINGISNLACSAANLIGWSKPQVSHSGNVIVQRPAEYFGNADGIDHSCVLGLSLLNNVDSFPNLSGTNLDECSFEYLKRIPNYIGTFKYNNKCLGLDQDNVLTSFFVAPTYYQPNVHTNQYVEVGPDGNPKQTLKIWSKEAMLTNLAYICSPFTYWTGSLVYTFRFVKTDYHSGRIEISFHPFVTRVGEQFETEGRYDMVYRVVVDLRQNSEVSVSIPYVSPQQWKAIEYDVEKFNPYAPNLVPQVPDASWLRYTTGMVVVRQLTPLICQSNIVSQSIDCLVEVRAGPDFRVACPAHSPVMPMSFPRAQSGPVYAVPGTQDTRTSAIEGFVPPSITGNDSDIAKEDTSMLTMGEIFGNFRQLTRRFYYCAYAQLKRGADRWNTAYNTEKKKFKSQGLSTELCNHETMMLRVNDFLTPPELGFYTATRNGWEKDTTISQVVLSPILSPTPLCYVASMYAFYRGGARFKVVMKNTTTTELEGESYISGRVVYRNKHDNDSDIIDLSSDKDIPVAPKYISPVAFELTSYKTKAEFQIPYYSPTIQSCHWNDKAFILNDRPLPWIEISTSLNAQNNNLNIAAGASDDMDFTMFIGPPPHVSTGTLYRKNFDTSTQIPRDVDADGNIVYGNSGWDIWNVDTSMIDRVDPAYKLLNTSPRNPLADDLNTYDVNLGGQTKTVKQADGTSKQVTFTDYDGTNYSWTKSNNLGLVDIQMLTFEIVDTLIPIRVTPAH